MPEQSDPDAPVAATSADSPASSTNIGWHEDPTNRFDLRYHNGRSWTADVSSDGERFVDPQGARPSPPVVVVPPPPAPGATPGGANAGAPGAVKQVANPVATASMVLGIIAVGIGWMPVIVVLGAIAAVLAITFGVTGRRRARTTGIGSGFALAGLLLGTAGLVVCVGGAVFTASMFQTIDRFENPEANTTAITSCELVDGEVVATGTVTNTGTETASYTVRVLFVRPGTDNTQRRATVAIDSVLPGAVAEFTSTVASAEIELDCIIGSVRGPLPYGIDPGT